MKDLDRVVQGRSPECGFRRTVCALEVGVNTAMIGNWLARFKAGADTSRGVRLEWTFRRLMSSGRCLARAPAVESREASMRPGSALRSGVVLMLAAMVVAVPTSALAKNATAKANSQTFTDSIGEDPSAPDITSVVVSNDDAGLVTFKINISNRPALTADMSVLLFLDTDQQAATGDSSSFGAEYAIELDQGSVTLLKWNGSDYVTAPSQSSVTFGYDSTGATIRASAADLGNTKAFNFFSLVFSGIATDAQGNADFSNAHADSAPDAGHGVFPYPVLTKLTLSVKAFTTGPKPAKAGKKFVASLAANESDTGGPVQAGTVACSAIVGGKHLSATAHRVANGIATCSWLLPRNAKGTLRGSVSLTVKGTTVVRSFAVKVT